MTITVQLEEQIEGVVEKVKDFNVNELRKGPPKPLELVEIERELRGKNERVQVLKKENSNLKQAFRGLCNLQTMEKNYNQLVFNEKSIDGMYEDMIGLSLVTRE